ncbi:MAG: response regulator [Pirellulales bacterium]
MKTRILFVDDQSNVLSGLRRMLRSLRNEWQMEFVESGKEALARMAESPFDVVISDMRMPGMDGDQLFIEIKNRYPGTVRIILSGQADHSNVLRTVTSAHQYLSKPCDTETLKATIARACSLRDMHNNELFMCLVSQVSTLPRLPHVYTQLLEELQSEDASLQKVAMLVSQDVGMTAKLMQMVNSSFFGIPRHIESPSQAVALLGLNILKPLVLSAGIFPQFSTDGVQEYSVVSLMEHSLAVSHLAQQIAKSHCDDYKLAEDALLAGLLHDVGQLLLLENLPEQYSETMAFAQENSISLYDAEIECLGASHSSVGAYLLSLWGIADPIVEAVAYHHQPTDCPVKEFAPLTAVHIANVLANEANESSGVPYCLDTDIENLEHLGIANQLPEWRNMADNYFLAKAELA